MPALLARTTLLLLVLGTAEGLVLPQGAVPTRASRLHAVAPRLLSPASHGATGVRMMASPEADKGKLPFFLDIGTKGGIVFYSIVGVVAPFVAYSYMVDVLDLGVVLAGNVILVLYVGLGIVAWTGRCAPRRSGPRDVARTASPREPRAPQAPASAAH